jgi:polysaccharide biosynthesis/export protein
VTRVIVVILALMVCACASSGGKMTLGNASVKVVQSGALPTPDRRDIVGEDRPYLIGPFDKLVIDEAAVRTPAELEAMLEQRLRAAYVRDPQVTVNLKETVSQVVTVDGEVKEPGLYPVIGRMTLMRAVATAKGTAEFAKLDDVVIFRTVQGQKMAGLYNLKAIRRGTYDDPEVFANDVVVVGDSSGRRLFKDGLQLLPAIVTPLIYILTR